MQVGSEVLCRVLEINRQKRIADVTLDPLLLPSTSTREGKTQTHNKKERKKKKRKEKEKEKEKAKRGQNCAKLSVGDRVSICSH